MAVPCVHLLLLLCLLIIPVSIASPHNLRLSPADIAVPDVAAAPDTPTTYFEVNRPLRPPPGSSGPCSTLLLSHSFAFTYTKPPVTAVYSPPDCLVAAGGRAAAISLAVIEWRATCRGVQFDRIFGVWLGGAELLRSCTAEPRLNGIVWSVAKDITKYTSLLTAGNSTLAVYLGNLINDQYTGVYHANLTLHLYFRGPSTKRPAPAMFPADLIVPISRSLPLNDGLWFQIQNATDVESASLTLPSNVYRAVIEVYVSFHGHDEFWYTNTPDSNGPFREVTVRVDGDLVGAVWPFPVIYTGGINPLLWRPITGIGSFNLPTYDIELTPFLGKLLDGKAHELGFAVTNAVDVWTVVRRRQHPPLVGPQEHGDDGGHHQLRRAAVSGKHDVAVRRPQRAVLHDGEPAHLRHRVGEVLVREDHDERHADVHLREHQRVHRQRHRGDREPDHRGVHRCLRHGPPRRRPVLAAGAKKLPALRGHRSAARNVPYREHVVHGGEGVPRDDGRRRRAVVVGAGVPVPEQHAERRRGRGDAGRKGSGGVVGHAADVQVRGNRRMLLPERDQQRLQRSVGPVQ